MINGKPNRAIERGYSAAHDTLSEAYAEIGGNHLNHAIAHVEQAHSLLHGGDWAKSVVLIDLALDQVRRNLAATRSLEKVALLLDVILTLDAYLTLVRSWGNRYTNRIA